MAAASPLPRLLALLARRVVRLDGAMGTMLGGANPDALVLTAPARVSRVHAAYLAAGADIVRTSTFRATSLAQQPYGLADRVRDLNTAAVRLARSAADAQAGGSERPFVAGVLGPIRGGTAEVLAAYREQAEALLAGGADLLLVETAVATSQALLALAALADVSRDIPVMVSATIDAAGRLPSGETVTAFHDAVHDAVRDPAHDAARDAVHASAAGTGAAALPATGRGAIRGIPLLSVGLNCGVGARGMRHALEELAGVARRPVSCHPSAGLPDARGVYPEDAGLFAATLAQFAADGLVGIVGGCCGTTPAYISAL